MEIRELRASELEDAARLLGRSMSENPLTIALFAGNTAFRRRALTRYILTVVQGLHSRGVVFGAFEGDGLLGVCAFAPPGRYDLDFRESWAVLRSLYFCNPPSVVRRVIQWSGEWAHRQPSQPHWHLGPIAVEEAWQGRGIGRALMCAFCERVDQTQTQAYLITDKIESVLFYAKYGFVVDRQSKVLGTTNWYMTRKPYGYGEIRKARPGYEQKPIRK